jgi:hypothetical protein
MPICEVVPWYFYIVTGAHSSCVILEIFLEVFSGKGELGAGIG